MLTHLGLFKERTFYLALLACSFFKAVFLSAWSEPEPEPPQLRLSFLILLLGSDLGTWYGRILPLPT